MNQLSNPMLRPLTRWAEHSQRTRLPQRDGRLDRADGRTPRARRGPGVRRGGPRPTQAPSRRRASLPPSGPARLTAGGLQSRAAGDLRHQSGSRAPGWGTIRPWPTLPSPCTSPRPPTTAWPCATTPSPAGTAPGCRPGPTTSTGPTVLLCNGLGTNPYAWPALLDPDCGVRVISWNHRGTGGSERPADPEHVGIDAFAEDAIAVHGRRRRRACVLMGWSMGVNTMFEVAVHHPERVTGLFAVGGVPGDTFASMGRRCSCRGRCASRSPSTSPACSSWSAGR